MATEQRCSVRPRMLRPRGNDCGRVHPLPRFRRRSVSLGGCPVCRGFLDHVGYLVRMRTSNGASPCRGSGAHTRPRDAQVMLRTTVNSMQPLRGKGNQRPESGWRVMTRYAATRARAYHFARCFSKGTRGCLLRREHGQSAVPVNFIVLVLRLGLASLRRLRPTSWTLF